MCIGHCEDALSTWQYVVQGENAFWNQDRHFDSGNTGVSCRGAGRGGKKHFIFFFFTSESGMLNCINTELESKWVCGTHALK